MPKGPIKYLAILGQEVIRCNILCMWVTWVYCMYNINNEGAAADVTSTYFYSATYYNNLCFLLDAYTEQSYQLWGATYSFPPWVNYNIVRSVSHRGSLVAPELIYYINTYMSKRLCQWFRQLMSPLFLNYVLALLIIWRILYLFLNGKNN